jgi:hypothetical protein
VSRTELHLSGLPLGVFLALAAGALALVVLLYRRDRGLVPGWLGRLLTALRAAAALLLLALFLQAGVRKVTEKVEPGELLLLLDASRSMALEDGYRPAWQKAREAEALGLLDAGERETTAARALAALPDLGRAAIPPAGEESIRRFAAAHGVAPAEVDGLLREIRARIEGVSRTAGSPPPPGGPPAATASEPVAAALEALQRRLDGALLESGGERGRAAAAGLEHLGRLDLARGILSRPASSPGAGAAAAPPGADPAALLSGRFRVTTLALPPDPPARQKSAGTTPEGRAPEGFRPLAPFTDLGQPLLEETLRRSRETLAGVVLVSDGRHNQGKRPEEAARALGGLGIPLFTLGVGSEEPSRDVRIADVDATGKVFAGDEIKAEVAIEAAGMGSLSMPLRISDGENTLKEVTAEVPAGASLTRIPISFPAPAEGVSGAKRYTVSFPPQPGEVTAANNSRDFWVNVLAGKARVLLLDGGPRWEYRYLKSVLGRDPNVKLDAFLVTRPPDRRLPEGFPRDRDALFGYDVFVLGDVESSVFSREELSAIRDLVEARGASLVLIAGPRALPYDYAETPLEDLLPVELERPRTPPGEGAALARSGFALKLTPAGERSPLTRLIPGRESNRELWPLLPPMDWFAPVRGARPEATVLAALPDDLARRAARGEEAGAGTAAGAEELERRDAAISTLFFGAGRVLYSGVDSTWKWRYRSGDQLLSRFWGQVIRWAASERLPPGDGQARLGTDEVRYQSPAKVQVRALLTGDGGKPIEEAAVDAVVRHAASGREERVRLQPVHSSGGLYRGSVVIDAGEVTTGIYQVRLETADLPGYSARADRATASFVVEEPPSPEDSDLSRDGPLLSEMARLSGPGGRYLPIDRARELPALVPERSLLKEEATTVDQWTLRWPLLLILAALLGAEWLLRKRFDLI